MNKTYFLKILLAIVVFGGVGVSTVVAKLTSDSQLFADPFDNGYYQKLLAKGDKNSKAEIDKLIAQVSERETIVKANDHLSADEKKREFNKTFALLQEESKKRALQTQPLQPILRGILNLGHMPAAGIRGFSELSFWGGQLHGINNVDTQVFSGVDQYNPSRGMLIIFNGSPRYDTYYTPTATGPIKIIAEKNGVLTLQSTGGTYVIYDDNKSADEYEQVTVSGGKLYYFDLKTEVFK